MNNYQYVPNPTGWIDPLGLSCKEVNYPVIGEGGKQVGTVPGDTKLYRYEPVDTLTPMAPHASPFFGSSRAGMYGLKSQEYSNALFVVTPDAVDDLTILRAKQGYFDNNVVLRETTVGDIMKKYPNAKILEDFIMNGTVLGGSGGLIIAA